MSRSAIMKAVPRIAGHGLFEDRMSAPSRRVGAPGRVGRTRKMAVAGAVAVAAATVAACGASASPESAPAAPAATSAAVSMATSVATATDSWAVLPVASDPAFWEVLARAGSSGQWRLVTPPGVADNGGLVASAGGASSLTVAVRPSQGLEFSPLAQTADGGASWSAGGPVNAAVAASPGALAADGSNLAVLLSDGTIETSSDAGTSWSALASPTASDCEPVRVTALSFGISPAQVLASGTCGTSGTAAVFSHSPGGWQRLSLPVAGQLVRFANGTALVRGRSGLSALWYGFRFGWYAYAPLSGTATPSQPASWARSGPLPASGTVTASGALAAGGAWVLLSDGRAATVGLPATVGSSGAAAPWVQLPAVPRGTAVLASGPGGAVDALAVSGATVTVWRLAPRATAWSQVEAISVPVQYGTSS